MRNEKSLFQLFKIKERQSEYAFVEDALTFFENMVKDHVGINDKCDPVLRYFMIESNTHQPQDPHRDFDYDRMTTFVKESNDYYIAFFPVTSMGMYLQLWSSYDYDVKDHNPENMRRNQVGKVLEIPYGKCVIFKGDTIHGGGFKFDADSDYKRFQIHITRDFKRSPLTFIPNNCYDFLHRGIFTKFSDFYTHANVQSRQDAVAVEVNVGDVSV